MYTNKSNSKKSWYKLLCKIRNILFYITLFSVLFISTRSSAQNAILSAGKTIENANYTLSYSIGELSIATYKKTTVTLTQGQQQGNLIITSLNEFENSGIQAKAYPNPTSNFVMLSIEGHSKDDLEYTLTNVSGSLLLSEKNLSEQQKISMNQYRSGIYFLTVSNRKKNNIHTFKIIKQ
ncbi:T9SS type A sorting domain-containing protein [uncultured Draconibacterium sp.]|uniref:T9SS type A sorting domain-containing protein n=1 Tax=uncultured Draconibacterium sp. TaxID=1573823 RepID=UPI0029C83316|nr:T9SS type A sorting domain-containing protein [uncultured Draconibacterium sp.]